MVARSAWVHAVQKHGVLQALMMEPSTEPTRTRVDNQWGQILQV
jgi:hypothetical protein